MPSFTATYIAATLFFVLPVLFARTQGLTIASTKPDIHNNDLPEQHAAMTHRGFNGGFASFVYPEFIHRASTLGSAVDKLADSLHDEFNRESLRRSIGEKIDTSDEHLVSDISSTVAVAREAFEDVKTVLIAVAESAGEIEAIIRKHAEGKSTDDLAHEMSEALSPIGKELQRLFPPPEMAPSHEERKQIINSTLASVEDALVELGLKFNVDEKRMHTLARDFCLHIETLVVSIGDLSEQHPVLRAILVSSVIAFIAPRISVWVLRPVLNLFGFGPAGPVKGSFAAWAQSTFLGAVIPKNSWFSLLQSAGMVKM